MVYIYLEAAAFFNFVEAPVKINLYNCPPPHPINIIGIDKLILLTATFFVLLLLSNSDPDLGACTLEKLLKIIGLNKLKLLT